MVRDPFARINERFARLGVRPIQVASPLDPPSQSAVTQAQGQPSEGDFQSHLSPDERQSLLSSIAMAPLSALGSVAGFLDKALGGRALRGLLGGEMREVLSVIPGSDVLGITLPEDIVSGRDVMQNLGVLQKNQPGFDFGDVIGFGAEVLLDPAFYLTLGGSSVLTQSGKGLAKTGKLTAVERAAATKAGAKALKLEQPMSKRLFRRNANLENIQGAQEDIVTLTRNGKEVRVFEPSIDRLSELRTYDATGNAIPITEAIKNTRKTGDLPDFLEPLGSPIGKGLPFRWKPHMGDKFLGVKTEKIARGLDWMGDKARWSYPGRVGAKIFSPELRGLPSTAEAQRSALRKSSVNEAVGEELDAMFTRIVNQWKDHGDFNVKDMVKAAKKEWEDLGNVADKAKVAEFERRATDVAVQNSRAVRRYIEGYEIGENGLPLIPDYDPGKVPDILIKLKQAFIKADDDLNALLAPERQKNIWAGRLDDDIIRQSDEMTSLQSQRDGLQDLTTRLELNPESQEFIDKGLEAVGMERGVHNRVKPRLPANLQHLEEDIDFMVGEMDSAAKFSMDMGLNIPDLGDWLAKYMPRDAYFIPEQGVAGAWRSARRRRLGGATFADDMTTDYTRKRADPLRKIYGGTDTLMDLTTKVDANDNPLYIGRIVDTMSDAEKLAEVREVAKLLAENEFKEFGELGLRKGEYVAEFMDDLGNIDPKKLEPLAKWLAGIDARHAEIGMPAFDINPIKMLRDYSLTIRQSGHAADMATDLFAETAVPVIGAAGRTAGEVAEKGAIHGEAILGKWAMDSETARNHLYAKLKSLKTEDEFKVFEDIWENAGLYDEAGTLNLKKAFQHITMPKEIQDDVTRYMQSFTRPESLHEFIAAWDAVSNIFRTSLTIPWMAFHSRNLLSGQMNNFYGGAADPTAWGPLKYIKPVSQAKKVIAGEKAIKEIANEIPQFSGKVNPATGLGWTDEEVTRLIREELSARGVVGAKQTREELVKMFEDGSWAGWADDMTKGLPGTDPMSLTGLARGTAKAVGGAVAHPLQTLMRIGNPKALSKDIVKGGRAASEYVEGLNRIAPFLAFLKQGMSFEEAARRVKLLQVDYRALSEVEKRVFKRTILFYSFTRRQIPFILGNLAGEPGGAMAQMIKGIERVRKASNEGELVPDWISHTPGLRIDKAFPGSSTNGMARYITNLGGLLGGAEDVLGVMRPGAGMLETARRTGSGIMGRFHPLIQRPIELSTGYSFFTGRPTREMKSPTARLLGQLAGREEPLKSFAGVPLTPATETVLQALPGFGRAVSTLKGLTDWPRRPISGDEGFSMANLAARFLPSTTGVRLTDVDLATQQNRLLQDLLEKQLEAVPEARKFEHMYIPKEELDQLDPQTRLIYEIYRKLGQEASKQARERKKRERMAAAYST